MLQASKRISQRAPNPDPLRWAPAESVVKDDSRYQHFMGTLLQDPIQCEHERSYRINATAVDSQHRKLFALANQVRELLLRRTQSKGYDDGLKLAGDEFRPLKVLLVWLRQYTVVHFDAEEKMMQEVNYLASEAHRALHRAFYGHVMMWGEVVDEAMELGASFHVGHLYVMVAKWLQDHVCVEDKLMESFLERSALRHAINSHTSPDAVDDTTPDCVPALVGGNPCVSLLQGQPAPEAPAPEWWAPAEVVAAHDYWYRFFVNLLLQSPVKCELARPFDIAVTAVDAQHHKLLTLVDRLRWLLVQRVWRLGFSDGLKLTGEELRPLHDTLVWLKQYAVVHFDNEEQVIDALNYPVAEHHKALHRAFYGHMTMASEAVDAFMDLGGGFHIGPIYVFMAKWVQDHICTLDKSIEKYVGKMGVKLNETEDIVPDIASLLPGQL